MELTERQKQTYRLILTNSFLSGKPTTQKEIYDNYPNWKHKEDGYCWNETSHDNCPAVWSDVQKINLSNLECIIIVDNFTYRIGTKEETLKYANTFLKKGLLALARYWNIKKRCDKDGQQTLFGNLKPRIDFLNNNCEDLEKIIKEIENATENA